MTRSLFISASLTLLLFINSCTNVTLVPTVQLPSQEKANINDWGIVTATCANISYDVSVDNRAVYTGGGLLGAIVAAVDAQIQADNIESSIEKGGTTGLGFFLDDWNFGSVFQQTFFSEFKKSNPDASVRLYDEILYEDLQKKNLPKQVRDCDVIMDIHITKYGLESERTDGFSVFMNVTMELIRVDDKKKIASHTIRFDKEYVEIMKRQMYDLYAKQLAELEKEKFPKGKQFNYIQFKKTIPPPDQIFSLPFTVRSIQDYVKSDASLLKKQLKLAATEVSRALIQFLQLGGYTGLRSTVTEYLNRQALN